MAFGAGHTNLVLVQSDTQRGVDGQDQVLISLSPWNRQPKAKPVHFPTLQTNTLLSSLLPTSAPQLPSLPSHFSPTCWEPALSRLSPLPPVPSPSGSPPGLLPASMGSHSHSRAGGQSIPLLHCFCFILFHSFNKLPWECLPDPEHSAGKVLASHTGGALVTETPPSSLLVRPGDTQGHPQSPHASNKETFPEASSPYSALSSVGTWTVSRRG